MTKENIKKQIREAFDRRVSVRVYNEEKVSIEDMEFILDTAWLSPSSVGLEGWRYVVLDREELDKVKETLKPVSWGAAPQLDTASHFVLLLAEKNARYDSAAIKQSLVRRGIPEDQMQGRLDLYEAFQTRDTDMANDERTLWDWTAKQTYIAMGNMMTTAAMLGIDTCPIEGFNNSELNKILGALGIINTEKEAIATMISFGYRLKDPKHQRSRKERSEVITWFNK